MFAKVDTEAEQALAGAANITSIPTLMAFREGVLVFSQPGALPPQALDELIGAVKGLDMAEVHAAVAAQQDGAAPRPERGLASAAWTHARGTSGTPPASWSGRRRRTSSSPPSSPTCRPGRALDLAAGEGRNALWLAERGWEVTAVDFSLAGLDKGRALQERHERGRDLHVDWVHADVLDLRGRRRCPTTWWCWPTSS